VFTRARQRRYIELLGPEVGEAFAGLDKACRSRHYGSREVLELFKRILDVEPEFRLQAVLYLSAPLEPRPWQERAIRSITAKNQCERMAHDSRTRLAHPSLDPEERAKLEHDLANAESGHEYWAKEVEAVKELVREKKATFADFERRYRESLGAWPPKRS
jgi:hypothetical protein